MNNNISEKKYEFKDGELRVFTDDGYIRVKVCTDPEYPGVAIDLFSKNTDNTKGYNELNVSPLALVEKNRPSDKYCTYVWGDYTSKTEHNLYFEYKADVLLDNELAERLQKALVIKDLVQEKDCNIKPNSILYEKELKFENNKTIKIKVSSGKNYCSSEAVLFDKNGCELITDIKFTIIGEWILETTNGSSREKYVINIKTSDNKEQSYTTTLKISEAEIKKAEKFLSIDDFESEPDLEIEKDATLIEKEALFDDGCVMQIRVCSGQNNCWSEAVLFNSEGNQLTYSEPSFEFLEGEWTLEYDGIKYSVLIESVES